MTEYYDTIQSTNIGTIVKKHNALTPHAQAIAEYFRSTQTQEIRLQSGDVVITAKYGSTLDGLKHQHTFQPMSAKALKNA